MGNTETAIPNGIQSDISAVKSVLIVVPLTRKWAVEMQAKQLAALHRYTDIDYHLLIYIDNNDIPPAYVEDKLNKYEMTLPFTVKTSRRPAPHEIRLYYRRERIKQMLTMVQTEIKKLQQFDMMFMVEDDTQIAPDTLQRLLADYKDLTDEKVNIGFIEGAQVGRHGIRMIGAWRCDDVHNPTTIATIPFNTKSFFEKIDGGGLYCFITPMPLFLAHEFYWQGECFSVDVTYGLELRKKGYINIIDWTIAAGHVDQNGNVLLPNENCTIAEYKKTDDGEWKLQNNKKGKLS